MGNIDSKDDCRHQCCCFRVEGRHFDVEPVYDDIFEFVCDDPIIEEPNETSKMPTMSELAAQVAPSLSDYSKDYFSAIKEDPVECWVEVDTSAAKNTQLQL
eukprot:TRINITY_DN78177_c0_g1_i1.p1 TRINITY_DN78177_c0_g1~~TRINITY_DN78177_c0_g1_i1.p1  ORF type:complete len:101 (+),score=19.82 TRINITY_DN78177_c0_g1_i1:77-379(+)